jgi:tetratricopeptide (TPR) repeat protein
MSAPSAATVTSGPSPVIGRSEIADWLREAVGRAREGRGGAFLLVGETGVGKSTLLAGALDVARRAGCLVLEGRAVPREIPQPFEPLKEALQKLPTHARQPPTAAPRLPGLWVAEPALPRTLVPMGFITWNEKEEAPAPAASDEEEASATDRIWRSIERGGGDVEEDRLALFDRIHQALNSAAREQPVVLVLEDLQNADRPTLEFFRYLARHLAGASIVLVGTATPWEGEEAEGKEVMEGLAREGLLEIERVRPLNLNEVAEYLRWLSSGREPEPATVTRLFAASEGNPLFLERLARGERGRVHRHGGPSAPAEEGEEGEDRPSLLAEAPNDLSRRLLVYGAVLGKEFPFAAVARLSEGDEELVAQALERLVRQGVLVERPHEIYAFHTETVRTEVLASLTETRRRRVHRRLGEVLEVLGPGPEGEEAWVRELALHFHQGRHSLRSYEYNCRLYEFGRHQGHLGEASEALDRALEAVQRLTPGPQEHRDHERDLLIRMGELRAELGELRRSEERLLQAAQMFPPNEPHPALDLSIARTHLHQGRYSEVHRRVEPLLPAADDPHPRPLGIEAAGLVAEAALALGRSEEAFARASVALRMAEGTPDPILLGDSCRRLADWYLRRSDEVGRARALEQRAARLYEERGDRLRRERASITFAELEFLRGRSDEGFRLLEAVAAWAREGGARLVEVEALVRDAHFSLDVGRLDRALRALERAQVLIPASEGPRFELHYGILTGRHAHRRGDAFRGRGALDRAEEVARASGTPAALCEVLLVRAEAELARGEKLAASRLLKEARDTGSFRAVLEVRYRHLPRQLD